jgi:hypothetical protein
VFVYNIFLSSVFFLLIFIQKVCELIVYLCNDTGNDPTGGSDIFMTLCIINLNSLLIIPSCTRKKSLSCRHQWLVHHSSHTKCLIEYWNKLWKVELETCRCQINPPVHHFSHPKCFQIMNIQIVEFDCYLRERTVPILLSFIKKLNVS